MSIYSGKCDFADHLFMQKQRTKNGSDKLEDLQQARVLYSDEQECFEVFKKKTGGVIYQLTNVELTKYNAELIAKYNPFFETSTEMVSTPIKNGKQRIKVLQTYKYFGKEATLKELNKKGLFIYKPIKFNTLLDLIPYYPYIPISVTSSNGKEECVLSSKSQLEELEDLHLSCNTDNTICEMYRTALQKHYAEVVLRYFNPEDRERTETVTFDKDTLTAKVQHPIDENFELKWSWSDEPKCHWAKPRVVDAENGIIAIHETDYKVFGATMSVYYVEANKERKLYLE